MSWSEWAKKQKAANTEIQTCANLGGISKGCFWRMIAKNMAPGRRNLEKMAAKKGILTWQLLKEVHEIGNKKGGKFDDFAA